RVAARRHVGSGRPAPIGHGRTDVLVETRVDRYQREVGGVDSVSGVTGALDDLPDVDETKGQEDHVDMRPALPAVTGRADIIRAAGRGTVRLPGRGGLRRG